MTEDKKYLAIGLFILADAVLIALAIYLYRRRQGCRSRRRAA